MCGHVTTPTRPNQSDVVSFFHLLRTLSNDSSPNRTVLASTISGVDNSLRIHLDDDFMEIPLLDEIHSLDSRHHVLTFC
jgi:hypothetical protein